MDNWFFFSNGELFPIPNDYDYAMKMLNNVVGISSFERDEKMRELNEYFTRLFSEHLGLRLIKTIKVDREKLNQHLADDEEFK